MFKVGDKVRIHSKRTLAAEKLDGKVVTVKEVNTEDNAFGLAEKYGGGYVDVEERDGGIWFDELELVKKEEIKIGDWVKVVRIIPENCYNQYKDLIGKTYRVESVNTEKNRYRLEGSSNVWFGEELEKVESPYASTLTVEKLADSFAKVCETEWIYGDGTGATQKLPIKKKGSMTLSKLARKLLSADIRTLVSAGYLDSELDITENGVGWVAEQYLLANLAELAKVAKKELKDAKDEKDED